jgi:hypothetical protein
MRPHTHSMRRVPHRTPLIDTKIFLCLTVIAQELSLSGKGCGKGSSKESEIQATEPNPVQSIPIFEAHQLRSHDWSI